MVAGIKLSHQFTGKFLLHSYRSVQEQKVLSAISQNWQKKDENTKTADVSDKNIIAPVLALPLLLQK